MGLEIGRVDHDGLLFPLCGPQTRYYPSEDIPIDPPLPAIVEHLLGAVGSRYVTPTQAIAIDEDNPTPHTPVIDAWFAVGLRKEGLETHHLGARQL